MVGGHPARKRLDAPSRRAEALFEDAFPGPRARSAIVLVASRPDAELTPDDLRVADQVLAARLREILAPGPGSVVARLRTPGEMPTGVLLRSQDRRAALVVAELTTEFLAIEKWPVVAAVEELVRDLRQSGAVPPGLEVTLSGSAVLGRDTGQAEVNGARAIHRWTILVVVTFLLLVYRTPVLAALRRVGAAITASAATVMFGVAMMGFAEFGKLRQARLAIAFTLLVVLAAALTFAPSLLCLTGRWAFWPRSRPVQAGPGPGGEPRGFWGWLGRRLIPNRVEE